MVGLCALTTPRNVQKNVRFYVVNKEKNSSFIILISCMQYPIEVLGPKGRVHLIHVNCMYETVHKIVRQRECVRLAMQRMVWFGR